MIFLFFTDVHATLRSPASRIDDYFSAVLSKLNHVARIGKEVDVDFYLFGADLFHSPEVSNSCASRVAKALREFQRPIYTAVGSHDHYTYQWKTLHRTSLGLLDAAGVLQIVKKRVIIDNCAFSFSHHSHIENQTPKDLLRLDPLESNCNYHVHVIHNALYPTTLPGDYILTKDYPKENNVNLVLSGHIHTPFSDEQNGILFLNPGSLLRVARNEHHTPSVLVCELTQGTLKTTTYNIPCEPYDAIFKKPSQEDTFQKNVEVDFSEVFKMLSHSRGKHGAIDIYKLIANSKVDTEVKEEALTIFEEVHNGGY